MIRKFFLFFIRLYQSTVSPFLGRWCRFTPSCSEYGYQAILQFGVIRGGQLTLRRLLRCHPFCSGGHDPVPETSKLHCSSSIQPLFSWIKKLSH